MAGPLPTESNLQMAGAGVVGAEAAGLSSRIAFTDLPALMGVYTDDQVDAIISGLTFLTSEDIDTLAEINAILGDADVASVTYVDATFQPLLVSGTNIKTINSTSLLGSGDIAVSASPAGSSGQLQYNNAGAFGGTTAIVYAGNGSHLTVTAQSATDVPFRVKGAASQSGRLIEAQNSAGLSLFYVDSAGGIYTGYTTILGSASLLVNGAGRIVSYSGGVFGWATGSYVTSGTVEECGFRRDATNHIRLRTPAGADCKLQLGTLRLTGLATSDPAIAGEIWNDAGTLKISAG